MAWRGQTVTRVSKIKLNVLGTRDPFDLRAKAMEPHGLLLFTTSAAKKYASVLGNGFAQLAVERAQCIVDYVELLREQPTNVPLEVALTLHNLWARHMVLIRDLDMFTPKHHMIAPKGAPGCTTRFSTKA